MTRYTSTTGLIQKEEVNSQTSMEDPPKSLLHQELTSLQNPKSILTRTMSSPAGSLIPKGFEISGDLSRLLQKCEEGNNRAAISKTMDEGVGSSTHGSQPSHRETNDTNDVAANSNNNNESSMSSSSLGLSETSISSNAGSRKARRAIRQPSIKRLTDSLEEQWERQQQAKFNPTRPPRSPKTSGSPGNYQSGTQSPESTPSNYRSPIGSADRSGNPVQLKEQISTSSTNSAIFTEDEDDDDVFVKPGEAVYTPTPAIQQEDTIRVINPPRRIQFVQTHPVSQIGGDTGSINPDISIYSTADLGTTPGVHLGPELIPPYVAKTVDIETCKNIANNGTHDNSPAKS